MHSIQRHLAGRQLKEMDARCKISNLQENVFEGLAVQQFQLSLIGILRRPKNETLVIF